MLKRLFYNPLGFSTLLGKEVKRYIKIYAQTILTPLLSNLLFLGIFGGLFETRSVGIEGLSYLSYIVPGLASLGAMSSAFQNPAYSLLVQRYQGTLQELNLYPLSIFEKVFAHVLAGALRGLLVGTLTYIATIFFVGAALEYPILFFGNLFIISIIFSSWGVVVGLLVKDMDRLGLIFSVILTPLMYLSGVFYDMKGLPGILPHLRFINPLYYLITGTRAAYLGYEAEAPLLLVLVSISLALGSFFVAHRLIKKGIGLKN